MSDHKTDTTWLIHQGVYHPYQPAGSTVGFPRRSIESPMVLLKFFDLNKNHGEWIDQIHVEHLGRCWIYLLSWYVQMLNHVESLYVQMLNLLFCPVSWKKHTVTSTWISHQAGWCPLPERAPSPPGAETSPAEEIVRSIYIRLNLSIHPSIHLSIYVNDVSLDLYNV